MDASIVIRTYNEEQHLPEVLRAIESQSRRGLDLEVVIVDSGSTDNTLAVASQNGAKIVGIEKSDFTFGRSLNVGCDAADGEHLIFLSGHCIPASDDWLYNLLYPLRQGSVSYAYGRQVGNGTSKFSECQLFRKYFPETSQIPQEGFFVNNANAALPKEIWKEHAFDEDLTGLEDMELGRRLVGLGLKLGYVSNAPVYHLHDESWAKVRVRYEREAIALQHIMPQVHVNLRDFLRYFASGVLLDCGAALGERQLRRRVAEIVMFRFMQFWGTYRGNNDHRKLSAQMKEQYFYPK